MNKRTNANGGISTTNTCGMIAMIAFVLAIWLGPVAMYLGLAALSLGMAVIE